MTEIIKAVGDLTRNPNGLLVLAGLLLLVIAAWGRVEGKINLNLDYPSRVGSGIIGVALTATGILLQLNVTPSATAPRTDQEILQNAYILASGRNFREAIKTASRISRSSVLFPKAQHKSIQWREQLEIQQKAADHAILQQAFEAASQGDFKHAIELAKSIPKSSGIYDDASRKIALWQESIQLKGRVSEHSLYAKAYSLADQGRFGEAIEIANQLEKDSNNAETKSKAHQKSQEWMLAQRSGLKAADQAMLQKSYDYAASGDFQSAISNAQLISRQSQVWQAASRKIKDWERALAIRTRSAAGKI